VTPRYTPAAMSKLVGAIAAAVTPLAGGGSRIDEDAIPRLARFLASSGIDGVLTCGTTGEGMLLTVAERQRVTELFVAARLDDVRIVVHAGAQTTADTTALSAHAAEHGADAVAVIAPPYFPLDGEELFRHFARAAGACAPVPFYAYEFEQRSGYAIPIDVVRRMRAEVPNFAGLKVSDQPFEALARYLLDGVDVFVGHERLVLEGLRAGAVGSVSGLASAWPEVVRDLVHGQHNDAHARVCELREALTGVPFHAALKASLADRGILVHDDVRPPLRHLTDAERSRVRALA
jgi:dihydrodipicolinate synthase/N-acetylneuraminate lyase